MEAVAYGVPVITSKYCGFSDYMGNTKEYMTFNPFDVDTLEKAIFDFYNFTKGQRLSVLNEQVTNVLKVGSLENCVDERLYFYEKIERKCSLEHNILFVTPDNFENQITEDILLQKYNSILFLLILQTNLTTTHVILLTDLQIISKRMKYCVLLIILFINHMKIFCVHLNAFIFQTLK